MKDDSLFPQVEQLINDSSISPFIPLLSRPSVIQIIRKVLEAERSIWKESKKKPNKEHILQEIQNRCVSVKKTQIQRVINATGVIIHTNLGRSPIAKEVWMSVEELNTSYASVEYDIESGKRGVRNNHISTLLSHLSGAENGMVVNNNASALYMILSHFAQNKEVIVSRSELVQIGGGFRIPDIMKHSLAILVEVGTTNVTTIEDYLDAITENTAMVLKVHRSNFALRGFTKEVSIKELAQHLPHHIHIVSDQGSGMPLQGYPGEMSISHHIKMGADLVSFSSDKVLSSVQGGCIVGKEEMINSLLTSPLYRVLRPGKTVLTLLEHTLIRYLNGEMGHALHRVGLSIEEQKEKAQSIVEHLSSNYIRVVTSHKTLGGGSSPDEFIEDISICIHSPSSEKSASYLRNRDIPIISTIDSRGVLLHLSTIFEEDIPIIISALQEIVESIECT